VEKLQRSVYSLALGIIDKGDHTKKLEHEIEKLHKYDVFHIAFSCFNCRPRTLEKIKVELDEINQQNRWLLSFYRKINKERVGKCLGDLDEALREFQVCLEPFLA
jgi:CRISPR/Cas system-associated endoribonuclease Cas2